VMWSAQNRVHTRHIQLVAVLGLSVIDEFACWPAGALGDSVLSTMTKWGLSHIEILEEHAPWWNVETDTSLWAPYNLMHTNTFWVLSPGVSRQGFTDAIMAWVESPWDSSHLLLVPRKQQRSLGCVNKHVKIIG
jgi:hypothetical protein